MTTTQQWPRASTRAVVVLALQPVALEAPTGPLRGLCVASREVT